MMRASRRILIIVVLMLEVACRSAGMDPAAVARSRTRTTLISYEEITERGHYSNLYVLIQELRPRWLRAQGPDTFIGVPGQVQVHMDGNRLGGVHVLRSLAPVGVTSIRWLPPIDAAARYGLNNSHGAIVISTGLIH